MNKEPRREAAHSINESLAQAAEEEACRRMEEFEAQPTWAGQDQPAAYPQRDESAA